MKGSPTYAKGRTKPESSALIAAGRGSLETQLSGQSPGGRKRNVPPRDHSDLPDELSTEAEPNVVKILSMNGYRDTRKWDSLANRIKQRVPVHRRQGLEIPYVSEDDVEDNLKLAQIVGSVYVKKVTNSAPLFHNPPRLTVDDLKPLDRPDIQSNFCFSCWMLVASEPVGLVCTYCPVIAHRHCVRKLQVEGKRKVQTLRQRHALDMGRGGSTSTIGSSDSMVFDEEEIKDSKGAPDDDMTEEEINMKWICPFCLEELHRSNDYMETKEQQALKELNIRRTSLSLTATAKMFVVRKKWIERVRNSIKIQRFFRSKIATFQLREEFRAAKSVLRIGLFELELFLDVGVEYDYEGDMIRNIGQFGSIVLNSYLKALPKDKMHLKTAVDSLKNCLTTPLTLWKTAEKAVQAKSILVTITVHDSLDGDKQIYRIDVPFVESQKKTLTKTSAEKINSSESAADDLSTSTNAYDLDDLSIRSQRSGDASRPNNNRNRNKVYFRPQTRGVAVFPACHADVFVRFTVSEISKWPNSVLIARSEMAITDYLLKRQVAVFSQRLEPSLRGEKSVDSAQHCRLNIAAVRGVRLEPSRFVLGHGRLSWAVVSATSSSTVAGPLLLLPAVDAWGAKKRTWCAIIDKLLYIYGAHSDIVPKEVIDLPNCKVFSHNNEVFEIEMQYGTRKTVFAYSTHPQQRSQWWGQISQASPIKRPATSTDADGQVSLPGK